MYPTGAKFTRELYFGNWKAMQKGEAVYYIKLGSKTMPNF